MNISNNLVPFANNGLELVINTNSGETFASQRALARMCEVSEMAIRKWIGANQIDVIIAEINTHGGKQTANLLPESSICKALAKYNPALLVVCAQAGLRVYLHKLAGFEVQSTATQKQPESNPFDSLGVAITNAVAELVRRELAKQANPEPSDSTRPRAELPASIVKMIDKREKTKQAYAALIEIRNDWCKLRQFQNQLFADCAFLVAAKNGEIPEVQPLLPFVKWGNQNGLSRSTLARARKRIKEGETFRKDPWAERDR